MLLSFSVLYVTYILISTLCVYLKNHILTDQVEAIVSSNNCMATALIGCEKKYKTLRFPGNCQIAATPLSNWSNLPGTMSCAGKKQVGMFYGLGMRFLNSDLFVAVPPTGGEQPYKLDFFTHLSDGRAR